MGTTALSKNGARPLGSHLFPVWPSAGFAATVLPVRCAPGDNLALHVAVAQAPAGSALVVDTAAEPDYGYVDELLAVAARVRDIAGIVIDGCVRDIAAIARCELPTVSGGVSVHAPGRDGGGAVGQEILLGTPELAPVRRGDWVVADDDGVVCLPRGQVTSIVAETVESVAHEHAVLMALSSGKTTLDLLDLDPSSVVGWDGGPALAEAAGRPRVSRAGNPA